MPASATLALLTLLTVYSGLLLQRLYRSVPGAVLYGDIGEAAFGAKVCVAACASAGLAAPCMRGVSMCSIPDHDKDADSARGAR